MTNRDLTYLLYFSAALPPWTCLVNRLYKLFLNIFLFVSCLMIVVTLTSSEREDSSEQLLPVSWDQAEYEQYQFGDSEKGTLPLISGHGQCPKCGAERVSTYMRQGYITLHTH